MKALCALTMLALLVMGCGGGDDTSPADDVAAEVSTDAGADIGAEAVTPPADVAEELTEEVAEDVAPELPPPDPKCDLLMDGTVTGFDVDGDAREFILDLPDGVEEGGPWPVIFNFHGYGDTAGNMRWLLAHYVNLDYPFILVTPEDLNIPLVKGVDWDVLRVEEGSKEARLFDEVLACLGARYPVDPERVHLVGFSAGAIACDLIGVLRGDLIASIVSWSGVYFSNPLNDVETISGVEVIFWPEEHVPSQYAQVALHGGTSDQWGVPGMTLYFNQFNENDVGYMNGLGHDLVVCDHGRGHTVPPEFGAAQALTFLEDHPRGVTESPYRQGLPEGWPDYCAMQPAP